MANERIQRLRLRAGWNLVSLAVTAPDFLNQLQEFTSGPVPVIKALYRWQPATKDYATIASGESVAAGTVLWVSVQTDTVVAVRGGYVEPTEWRAPASGTFVAVLALEPQSLTVPAGVILWRYDARSGRWQAGLAGDLVSLSDLPPTLAPGEAIYVHSNEPADLGAPASEERLRYYHQDHLGSSSVMTDADGALIEETAFYPFGTPRHEHRLRQIEAHYKFTQKERDQESGLYYFEARYLLGLHGRFASPDPLVAPVDPENPQNWNCYAYTVGNPLKYVDPHGLFQWDATLGGNVKDADVKGENKQEILTQRKAFREARQAGMDAANKIANAADKALVLKGLDSYGAEGVANVTIGIGGTGGKWRYKDGKHSVTFASGLEGERLTLTLAHEGLHFGDAKEFWDAYKQDRKTKDGPLNRTDYDMEFRGYRAESILAQAMGRRQIKIKDNTIWDSKWKAADIEKNRTAGINQLLKTESIYQLTPQNPGVKLRK